MSEAGAFSVFFLLLSVSNSKNTLNRKRVFGLWLLLGAHAIGNYYICMYYTAIILTFDNKLNDYELMLNKHVQPTLPSNLILAASIIFLGIGVCKLKCLAAL